MAVSAAGAVDGSVPRTTGVIVNEGHDDDQPHAVTCDVKIPRSSWIEQWHFLQLHTNAVNVPIVNPAAALETALIGNIFPRTRTTLKNTTAAVLQGSRILIVSDLGEERFEVVVVPAGLLAFAAQAS